MLRKKTLEKRQPANDRTALAARIKDVALEAGVSTATVSHVINKTKHVTDRTRERVLGAIERCNYYPNAHARTLASGRSKMIGLLVSDIANPFFPELVKSFETASFERGYNIILLNTNYDAKRAADYVRRLIELKVAGVALMTSELDPALIDELARKRVNVVFHNLGTVGQHMSNMLVDYRVGIEEAVYHLVSLGHHKIVHVSGPACFRSAVTRREAFIESMSRHLPDAPATVYEGDFKFEGGRRAASEILAGAEMPTGVVVANDMMAFGVIQEFRAAGLTIPRDVSIIGFDDISFATQTDPPLTTVHSPRLEIGRRAVEALMMTIERPGQQGVEVRIPTYLIKRGSTAPPPMRAR
ncbi:MAG TPA: LacI family DNA-binding transcriptional regulator [Pyrinomonadaceae bacterium]|nr:LacI family DNA-binding transcriptional regulator [Pyrinomonadaceae bacterium]